MHYNQLKQIEAATMAARQAGDADAQAERLVRITAGDPDHPLHGHLGMVAAIFPPLPPGQEIPLHPQDTHAETLTRDRDAFDQPFAWPDGKVLLWLGNRAGDDDGPPIQPGGRRWLRPYVTVSPADIELAKIE